MKPPVGAPIDPQTKTLKGFFLYEIRSKRRSLLSPTTLNAWNPVWSQDGLQVFFTGQEPGKSPAIYRIFWDGTSLQRYALGTTFVVGQ
jgi:Tol biopolymer transport system component